MAPFEDREAADGEVVQSDSKDEAIDPINCVQE